MSRIHATGLPFGVEQGRHTYARGHEVPIGTYFGYLEGETFAKEPL